MKAIKTILVMTSMILALTTTSQAKEFTVNTNNAYEQAKQLELQKKELQNMISIYKKFLTKAQKEQLKQELKAK